MNIIGITGAAGAGKSTVADILSREHRFVVVSLADEMKRICARVFGFTDEQLWGPSEKRNEPDPRWPLGGNGIGFLTPRHALQLLGTEWGRTCSENVWVEYVIRIATAVLQADGNPNRPIYSARHGLNWGCSNDTADRPMGIVVPDVRYDNEARAIIAAGGSIWRKQSDPAVRAIEKWRSHSSEAGVSEGLIDHTIGWCGDLEELSNEVRQLKGKAI